MLLVGALLITGLAACTHDKDEAAAAPATPLQLTSLNLSDVTKATLNRNVVRPVIIDDDLQLDPSTSGPRLAEADALSRWRHLDSTVNGGADKVAIVHADASLTIPISANVNVDPPPYKRVPSWVVLTYAASRSSNCLQKLTAAGEPETPPAGPRAEILDVTLVADDGTQRIVSYRTRGLGICATSQVTEPSAEVASTTTSIPWKYTTTGVRAPGYRTLVRDNVAFALPACSYHQGTSGSAQGNAVDAVTYEVGKGVGCGTESSGVARFQRLRTAPLGRHAPTGPLPPIRPWPTIKDGTATPPTLTP